MGIVELDLIAKKVTIFSNILLYGNGISEEIRRNINDEIETMWNEPKAIIQMGQQDYQVNFKINTWLHPQLTQQDIVENVNPKNNYFRIENTSNINISFVDGIGCNTGYFFIENLYKGSTTAAHEYGHTIGLDHPDNLDIRGEGTPGIMYPRGTIVDAQFQYNPSAIPGDNTNGGTMHPIHRKVLQKDISDLQIHRLVFTNNQAIIGAFSSIWHEAH